jgi:hypothetical protein
MFAKIQLNFFVGLDTLYRGAAMLVDREVAEFNATDVEVLGALTRKSVEIEVRESLATYGWAWAEMYLGDYLSGAFDNAGDLLEMVKPVVDKLFPEFQ